MLKMFKSLFDKRKQFKNTIEKEINAASGIAPFIEPEKTEVLLWDVKSESKVPDGVAYVGFSVLPKSLLLNTVHSISVDCCNVLLRQRGMFDNYDRLVLHFTCGGEPVLQLEIGSGRVRDVAALGRMDFARQRAQIGAVNYTIKPIWYFPHPFTDESEEEFAERKKLVRKKK